MMSATTMFVAMMVASVEVMNACVPPICVPPTSEIPAYKFGDTNNLLVIFAIIVGAVACVVILMCVIAFVCCYFYRHEDKKAPELIKRIYILKKRAAKEKQVDLKLVHRPAEPQPNIIVVQPPLPPPLPPPPVRPPTLTFTSFENGRNPTLPIIKARLDSHMTFAINEH